MKFFSRRTGPILTKLDTKHLWMKGIQVCLNEGPGPFPRGDHYEIEKTLTKFKNLLSNWNGLISTKLGTKRALVKGTQECSNEDKGDD